MSEHPLKPLLEHVAGQAIPPDEIDLWPGVASRIQQAGQPAKRHGVRRVPRPAIPVLVAVMLLALALLLIGPDNVLAALRGLFGYVPGIGIVDESAGLRVLAEPVAIEREGIRVSVEQVVVDSEQTVVVYEINGVGRDAYPLEESDPGCVSSPAIRLPDGALMGMESGTMGGSGSSFAARFVFPSISSDVEGFTLLILCLEGTRAGAAPENWEFTLRLIPAPEDFVMAPVLVVTEAPKPTASAEPPSRVGLYLERVIDLENSFVLIGTFRQGSSLPGAMVHGISEWPTIEDASGYIVPIVTPNDLDLVSSEVGIFPWAYEVPKGFTSPLTITLEAVAVEFPADVGFEFDVGSDPQPGQEWHLDRPIEVAGHKVVLVRAVRLADGYELHFESDPSVSHISVDSVDHRPRGGGGGGQQGEFSVAFHYGEPVPDGVLRFRISGLFARHAGPWTLSWEPPAGSHTPGTLVVPQPCVSLDRWLEVSQRPSAMPESGGDTLLLFGRIVDVGQPRSPENAGVFKVDLATGARQIIGPGYWPSISPDGTRIAYSLEDGLHILDLATGDDRHVPGTSINDYGPQWSPDGTRIAFNRTDDFNLYVVNTDGMQLMQATEGPESEQLVGWMPDDDTLAYVLTGTTGGMPLRFIDLTTGAVRDGFVLDERKGLDAAVSPDGRRIAYSGVVPGRAGYGVYVADIDGSSEQLLIHFDNWNVYEPAWSPDGSWLAVAVFDPTAEVSWPAPALVQIDTCNVVPLLGVEGEVYGWSP